MVNKTLYALVLSLTIIVVPCSMDVQAENGYRSPETIKEPSKALSMLHLKHYRVNLPAQQVAQSLNDLAAQTGVPFLYPYHLVMSMAAPAITGEYTVLEAVQLMLKDTNLKGGFVDGAVTISLVTAHKTDNDNHLGIDRMKKLETKKKLLATLIGMFVGGVGSGTVVAQQNDGQNNTLALEEIVVTAGKRAEGVSIQDTAMSISAISAEDIDRRGLVGMDDYLRSMPSISMQDRGAGQNQVIIRGLNVSGQSDGRTGIYFGEIPTAGLGHFGGSYTGGGNGDLKMVDIERVEVLRGPQGTLYGSGVMGGTVRVLPQSPNLEKMEGKLGVRYSNTDKLGGDNTMTQAVLNVPIIEDTLAIRGVAYQFDNSGFYENVVVSQPFDDNAEILDNGGVLEDRGDFGADKTTGFRLSALWQVSESLDATLSYIKQDTDQDGGPQENTSLEGKYQLRRGNTGVNGTNSEFFDTELDIINLVVNFDLGWGTLTSATSSMDFDSTHEADGTHRPAVVITTMPFSFSFHNAPNYFGNDTELEAFTQELRLSSDLEGPLQYLVGLYYEEYERSGISGRYYDSNSQDTPLRAPFEIERTNDLEQKAIFGELTYNFTEQLAATIGARHFDYDLVGTDNNPIPATIDEDGQTYKANITYHLNDDIMLYGQWAEGFDLGGPVRPTAGCGVIPATDSNTLENFEIGFKSSLADNRVTLNGSYYFIDWRGLPVAFATTPGCVSNQNIGKAESEGVELELQVRLTESVKLDVSTSYGEATVAEDLDSGDFTASKGDNLPGASDFTFSLGAEYLFTLGANDGFVRFDYAFASEYHTDIAETSLAAGDYGLSNLKVGVAFDQVDVEVFVNNMTNEDAITWSDTANNLDGAARVNRVRPRTMGLNVNYQF